MRSIYIHDISSLRVKINLHIAMCILLVICSKSQPDNELVDSKPVAV